MSLLTNNTARVEKVAYHALASEGCKHRVVRYKVSNIDPKNPVINFTLGELGLNRSAIITPMAIGQYCGLIWDGQTAINLDDWPEGEFEIVLDCWGW